ncbi:MAG: carbohydrate ABC transporter permease [bacterium]|nr:carbohydrate ABC transporter permease [Candidatus Sumerlaeota bacterium]
MKALRAPAAVTVFWYALFAAFTVFFLVPLLFMLGTSLKLEKEVYDFPVRLWPKSATVDNYVALFTRPNIPMLRWIFNSVYVTLAVTAGVLVIDSLAAFGFSRLEIPCKRWLFAMIIGSMMIPFPATLIPVYGLLQKLHWLDTYKALIIPPLAGPLGVFLLKQFFDTIPRDLEEAALLDGCSKVDLFSRIILPLSMPVMATLGILVFMGIWNSFLWPLIVTNSIKMHPLPVGLTFFNGEYWSERALVMAAAAVCAFPVLVVFLIFQRYIVRGIMMTGLKD